MTGQPLAAALCIFDGFNLLLPQLALAEVVSGVAASAEPGEQPWQLGDMNWRGQRVPVLSLEQLLIQRSARLRGSHLAVLRGHHDSAALPFYAVPIQAAPSPVSLDSKIPLEELEDKGRVDFALRHIRVRGVAAVIPDLKALEAHIIAGLGL